MLCGLVLSGACELFFSSFRSGGRPQPTSPRCLWIVHRGGFNATPFFLCHLHSKALHAMGSLRGSLYGYTTKRLGSRNRLWGVTLDQPHLVGMTRDAASYIMQNWAITLYSDFSMSPPWTEMDVAQGLSKTHVTFGPEGP